MLNDYFRENVSPGLLVYEEFLVANRPSDRDTRQEVADELERVHGLMGNLLVE